MKSKLTINPWVDIWTKPRATIRAIVEYDPMYRFLLLCGLYGFPMGMNFAQNFSLGQVMSVPFILLMVLIFSVFIGMLGVTISSGLLFLTGKLLDGKASFKQTRAVVLWANVPNVINIITWVVLLGTFGSSIFLNVFPETVFTPGQTLLLGLIFLIQTAVSIWSFVIMLRGLEEVQKFSVWKAILNIIIPFITVVVVLWFLSWLIWG